MKIWKILGKKWTIDLKIGTSGRILCGSKCSPIKKQEETIESRFDQNKYEKTGSERKK